MSGRLDLTGQRFGRLTVLYEAEPEVYHRPDRPGKVKRIRRWVCECDCGRKTVVYASNLTRGTTRSCGCYGRETARELHKETWIKHGMSRSRVYRIHKGMVQRCSNPNSTNYSRYGNRGIYVCDEWLGEEGFEHFYDWAMAHGYRDNLSIDRIDNDGPYAPWNCRWVDIKIQQNNMRGNKIVQMRDEQHTVSEWSELLNVSRDKIRYWMQRGLTGDELYEKLTEK